MTTQERSHNISVFTIARPLNTYRFGVQCYHHGYFSVNFKHVERETKNPASMSAFDINVQENCGSASRELVVLSEHFRLQLSLSSLPLSFSLCVKPFSLDAFRNNVTENPMEQIHNVRFRKTLFCLAFDQIFIPWTSWMLQTFALCAMCLCILDDCIQCTHNTHGCERECVSGLFFSLFMHTMYFVALGNMQ